MSLWRPILPCYGGNVVKEETILVVDDNREIVYSIGELLKYEGYHVVTAYDGMEVRLG